jgi:hypothetical protein
LPPNAAEELVEQVLRWLQRKERISGYLRNNPSDRLDSEGIDFLIFLRNGLALPLQVKTSSSERDNRDKMREHFRKHPKIRHIIMVEIHRDDRNAVHRHIARTIRLMIRDSMRQPWW